MGKLIRKLIHGIVPSWFTKLTHPDSPSLSPKKLLPFLRARSRRRFFSLPTSGLHLPIHNADDHPDCHSSSNDREPDALIQPTDGRSPSLASENLLSTEDSPDEDAGDVTQHQISETLQGDDTDGRHYNHHLNDQHDKEHLHQGSCSNWVHHDEAAEEYGSGEDASHREIGTTRFDDDDDDERIIAYSDLCQQGQGHQQIMEEQQQQQQTQGHMLGDEEHDGGKLGNGSINGRSEQIIIYERRRRKPRQNLHHQVQMQDEGRIHQDEGGSREMVHPEQREFEEEDQQQAHRKQHGEDPEKVKGENQDVRKLGGKRKRGEYGVANGEQYLVRMKKRAKGASCELPESISAVVGDGRAEVQFREVEDVAMAFRESMVEMIVGNGLTADMAALRFLFACYLCLNEPELHSTIHSSFLRVLQDLWIT